MQRTPRRLCVALGLAALTWPTTGANAAPAARPKKVYAHYMTCFTLDVGFCKEEIRLAQPHGLDGFAMDFGEWLEPNPPHNPTRYVANMDNVFETARQLGTRFKLLLTPEYCVQPVGVQVEDFGKGRGVTYASCGELPGQLRSRGLGQEWERRPRRDGECRGRRTRTAVLYLGCPGSPRRPARQVERNTVRGLSGDGRPKEGAGCSVENASQHLSDRARLARQPTAGVRTAVPEAWTG